MNGKWILLIIGIMFLASCTIEEQLERKEDRLIGSWEIDRARFKDDGFFNSSNITNEFRGDLLTFFEDGFVQYVEDNGEVFTGTWFLDALRRSGENDTTEYTLDADFYDDDGFLVFRWLGTIDRLDRNNFNLTVADRYGELILKWDRY
ncbi:MAG: hypothetical protein KJP00_15690 [Bacteroidia bacterium]|nr:hypothetical protein [Bacteroidia bacterium]